MRYRFENRKNGIDRYMVDNLNTDAHLHEHIEMGYIISGSSELYIEDKRFFLNSGDAFIIFPNMIHRYESSNNLCSYLIILNTEFMPEFGKTFLNKVPISPVISGKTPHIRRLLDIFFDITTPLPFESMRGIILAVTGIMLENTEMENRDRYNISTLKNILLFCESHYTEPITIGDVADNLHISRSHVSHIFKNKLNTSFGKYINEKRINLACDILKNTQTTVTETALDSGFSSLRTFNRIFAEKMGCTPREYRKNFRIKAKTAD